MSLSEGEKRGVVCHVYRAKKEEQNAKTYFDTAVI